MNVSNRNGFNPQVSTQCFPSETRTGCLRTLFKKNWKKYLNIFFSNFIPQFLPSNIGCIFLGLIIWRDFFVFARKKSRINCNKFTSFFKNKKIYQIPEKKLFVHFVIFLYNSFRLVRFVGFWLQKKRSRDAKKKIICRGHPAAPPLGCASGSFCVRARRRHPLSV